MLENSRKEKEKNIHVSSLVLMNVLMLVFLLILIQIKPIDSIKNYTLYTKSEYEREQIEVFEDITISQSFVCDDQTDTIEVKIEANQEDYQGCFEVRLYDDREQCIKSWATDKLDILSGQKGKGKWINYELDKNPLKAGKQYRLEISAHELTKENAICVTVFNAGENPNGYAFSINGEQKNQILAFALYQRQVNLFAIIAIIIVFLTANIWWFNRKKDISKSALWILLGTGMVMFLIMAPGSQPDEIYHYNSALRLSNIILGEKNNVSKADNSARFGFTQHFNVNSSYLAIQNEFIDVEENEDKRQYYMLDADESNHPIAYLAPALGMTVVRLLKGNYIQLYEAARLTNLLSYVFMCLIAIKLVPKKKRLLLLICIIPMAMNEAVSASRDTFVNGMSLIYIAYIINIIQNEKKYTWKRASICLGLLCLFGPVKIVYCVLGLLLFALHKDQFNNVWDRQKKTFFVIVGTVCFLLLIRHQTIHVNLNESSYYGSNDVYHIGFIFEYPIRYARLIINTIWTAFLPYVNGAIGNQLAGELFIPEYLYYSYAIVLVVAAFGENETLDLLGIKQRLVFCGTAILGYLLLLAAFSFATTYYAELTIMGIQGRYLLPFFAPVLFCIFGKKAKIEFEGYKLLYFVWFVELGYIVEVMSKIG